jgi:hypothetical protein
MAGLELVRQRGGAVGGGGGGGGGVQAAERGTLVCYTCWAQPRVYKVAAPEYRTMCRYYSLLPQVLLLLAAARGRRVIGGVGAAQGCTWRDLGGSYELPSSDGGPLWDDAQLLLAAGSSLNG